MTSGNQPFNMKIFIECLAEYGIDVEFYIDRVKFYVDAATGEDDLNPLQSFSTSQKLLYRELPHHHTFWLLADVRQPTQAYFRELKKAIRGDYQLNYIELAMDLIVRTRKQRRQLRDFMNRHLIYQRASNGSPYYFHEVKGTHYFGAQHQDARDRRVLAIYSDKPSKISPSKECVHLEFRLSGTEMLKGYGLHFVHHVLAFDHLNFWAQHLDLRGIEYQKLGALCSQATTPQGRIQAAKRALDKFSSLQEALRFHPEWIDALKPMNDRRKLQRWLKTELGTAAPESMKKMMLRPAPSRTTSKIPRAIARSR